MFVLELKLLAIPQKDRDEYVRDLIENIKKSAVHGSRGNAEVMSGCIMSTNPRKLQW